MRRFFAPPVAAAAVYVLLTIALTWPLVLHPASLVPNDLGDPLLNTWILAWDARVAPLTAAWWNSPQFYPMAGTLAFSEHLLGLSIFSTPIIALTGDPLLAYNAVFFLSFVLSALAAYLLAFTISRRHDVAFLAGLAFGFAPYRMAQFAHVQVLSAYWMPVALAALHRYVDDRRARWAALFALAWLMQALACGYYLFYLSVLVGLWLPWFMTGPNRLRAFVADRRGLGDRVHPARPRSVWVLALPACVWAATRHRRDHHVQRGRWQPAQGARQSAGLGLAQRRQTSRGGDISRPDDRGPRHDGVGHRLAQRGEGADRPAQDGASLCGARAGLLCDCRVAARLWPLEGPDRTRDTPVGWRAAQAAVGRPACSS